MYRDSDVILICFDIGHPPSLQNVVNKVLLLPVRKACREVCGHSCLKTGTNEIVHLAMKLK